MTVGDGLDVLNANWRFRGEVVERFDEHVSKSVPLYREGHQLIANLSDWFLGDDSVIYDLGCSTGTLLLKLAERNGHRTGARFTGIDNETEMIEKATAKRDELGLKNVDFVVDDISKMDFEPADLITAYYTIQFVRPNIRQVLFDKIWKSLNWGGAFICFEKVRANDARFQDIMTGIYTDYKLEQGYTPEEVVGKSRSLKGVLEPFSTEGNIDLMRRAGFKDITSIMKYVCFEGFLAIK